MPLILIVVGLMLLVTAMRGTTTALGAQLKLDLLGNEQQSGFIVWIVIIAILAVVGSIGAGFGRKDVQKLTQLFMGVVLVALILRNPNVVQQFVTQISAAPVTPAKDADVVVPAKSGAVEKGDILKDVLGSNTGNVAAKIALGIF